MPWTFALFEEVPQPVKGELHVPKKPGHGLKFDEKALKRYAV
jgi:L-alanine-DL-glutamate epimerase-like enolase superfamily enzyme